MGAGQGQSFGKTKGSNTSGKSKSASLNSNLNALTSTYKLTESGYFGEKSGKHIRNIESDNPIKTANDFFNKATKGAKVEATSNGEGKKAKMSDGYTITIREVSHSADKSPAVDIHIKGIPGKIKDQKIHFVKTKDDSK